MELEEIILEKSEILIGEIFILFIFFNFHNFVVFEFKTHFGMNLAMSL